MIEHYADHEQKMVYFGSGYPGAPAFKKLVAEMYPNYLHAVLTYRDFQTLQKHANSAD